MHTAGVCQEVSTSLRRFPSSSSSALSVPSFTKFPEPWMVGHWSSRALRITSVYFDQLWVSLLTITHCKENEEVKVLWPKLRKAQAYVYERKYLVAVWWCDHLQSNYSGFPQRPMTSLAILFFNKFTLPGMRPPTMEQALILPPRASNFFPSPLWQGSLDYMWSEPPLKF